MENVSSQTERYEQIQKALANFTKSPKSRITLCYCETRLGLLEEAWKSFNNTHDNIIRFYSDKERRKTIAYFTDNLYDECEDMYITYKSELKTKISDFTATQTQPPLPTETNPGRKHTELKLPSIKITPFSGKYTDWPTFHDLFESIIHKNQALDDVQKLHYLKTNVTGEAEQLLRNIPITGQNYSLAWSMLQKRYNNKRYISNCIFRKLFGLKSITSESAYSVKQLLDTTSECLNSLKNLGLPTSTWDAILIYMTVTKLDGESHKMWEQHLSLDNDNMPSLEALFQFLESRFRSMEMIEYNSKPYKPKTFHAAVAAPESSNKSGKCTFCSADHYIYQCKQFAKKDYPERHAFVQNNNLCFNCLIPKHSASKCKRETCCRICQKKHHSLLHPEKESENNMECEKQAEQNNSSNQNNLSNQNKPSYQDKPSTSNQYNPVSHFSNNPSQVVLATALVDIQTNKRQKQVYRALIDQGSQSSFVSEYFVQATGLKRFRNNNEFNLSEGKTLQSKSTVEFEITSRCKTNFTVHIQAYVLSYITTDLPQNHFTLLNWPELDTMTLADPGFNKPGRIDMLLGSSVVSEIMDYGLARSPVGTLAQNTHLGWIISGNTSSANRKTNKPINRICMHSCICDTNSLKMFWEIENEALSAERKLTKEEQQCEDIYKNTITRTETGRYKVHLPFKENISTPAELVGKTKEMAISRFLQLERKFKNNQALREEYTRVMNEYQELGHMTLADENNDEAIYLAHHAVIREDKETTKLRVVFDASAKGSKGHSLNDTLLTGPVIQRDLRTLIMKWRTFKIVLVSDVVKMYRQLWITENHTNYQRIVWRDSPQENLKSYKLLTVTFGTSAAPFLAVRTLTQAAEDEAQRFPLAAEIVKSSFYVDDLMTGSNSEDGALEIYKQVKGLLMSAGFELQKWSSNSDIIVEKTKQPKDNKPLEIKFDKIIKILGLSWDRVDDKFKFYIKLPEVKESVTKRIILSEIARLFDPFGWLAPIIVKAKILIQKLWLCTSGWDVEVPEKLKEEWLSYRKQLCDVENIQIDRWLRTQPGQNQYVELHGFADASTVAYAAVVYMKVTDQDGVHVNILESKTKVAPLKQISIARLELCAAGLLSRLLSESAHLLNVPKENVHAYTDSMIVLAWIEGQPTRWQTFVANRVTEIQKRLDNDRWNHVSSEDNPADLASRGVNPSDLKNKQIWWKGPDWLSQKTMIKKKVQVPETNLEERKQYSRVFHCEDSDPIWERFSSLSRMCRVLSYCHRFLSRSQRSTKQQKDTQQPCYLTSAEMRKTLDTCINLTQQREFAPEIESLKQKKKIQSSSNLITLSPYLGEDCLLRVGGRLQASHLAQERKHPIILPNKTHLTTLIVRDAHFKTLHGGIALTINYLRSRYWIIGLKQLVKKCYRECVVCQRHKGTTIQPLMGDLPSVRVNPGRAFEASGVDFAGPILMRTSKGRGQRAFKGYICIFVCMKTRAIHLEVVSDLTTPGFIAAFRRFVARRGHCSDMYSDNGTNFVGAARELTRMLNHSMTDVVKEVAELLSNDGTNWHFIPPRSPNFGGLWEAGVKSVKTHLIKTIGDSTLTYEEMSTLLTQVEACLNSRPLSPANEGPDDVSPLTPAHFLVGEQLVGVPERSLDEPINPLNRWKLIQQMMRHFWTRWSTEYLHTLQQRYKWQEKTTPIKIGDIVLVKESGMPPTKWLMAKVIDTHPGPEGQVRVVTLQGKGALFKRSASKLVVLPIQH